MGEFETLCGRVKRCGGLCEVVGACETFWGCVGPSWGMRDVESVCEKLRMGLR